MGGPLPRLQACSHSFHPLEGLGLPWASPHETSFPLVTVPLKADEEFPVAGHVRLEDCPTSSLPWELWPGCLPLGQAWGSPDLGLGEKTIEKSETQG